MPVNKITADQFATNLNTGIRDRNAGHDTEIGPIPDIVVQPLAGVLELQNDRIRDVSRLILLDTLEEFDDSDIEAFVFNEALLRNQGGRSTGTVIFSRATAPTADVTVQRNYPIATLPDESTGQSVVFITTESKTLFFASASSFFNLATQRYELEVAVRATVPGQIGEVGANKITRPLRPLVGFDNVFNRSRTSAVSDRETNNQLLERYKIAILGTQLATRIGLKLYILSKFQDAGNILVVSAGDPLITRAGADAGAVDVFVTGTQAISRTETKTFTGIGQIIPLTNQPVLSIISITGFVLGTDYELVKDTSGLSGSSRAQDGVRFKAGGASPAVGASFTITYQQDLLIQTIQSSLDDPDNEVGGQDPLIRKGTQLDITLTARLIVLPGFSFSTVQTAVISAILAFINALGLGDDVEQSDIQAEVRRVSGVDNFIFLALDVVGGVGNADISVEKNEYARITSGNMTITS